MCGISGVLSAQPITPADVASCDAMSAALFHRGPDGQGRFSAANVLLDSRRLSIIDVAGGAQPLYNEDRTLVLVANGEIYNYRELTQELEGRGHVFRTQSDCETILHLYEELGDACVQRLRGMFAFALWDETRGRALIVRDRMGEKPLYLHERPNAIAFASELRALVRSGLLSGALDYGAIHQYFHYHFVPEPRTPLADVRKLDAGHLLVVETRPWRVTAARWWDLEAAPPLESDPARTVRALFDEIAPLVVRSDVPVGVALSGGLDSSTVAALAAPVCPELQAFTVGYEGRPACDERQEAAAFAKELGIPLHEIELRTADVADDFAALCGANDDPIADISGYGYWAVMRLARAHNVPVMMMGQGADELFWGYGWPQEGLRQTLRKQRSIDRGRFSLAEYVHFSAPPALSPFGLRKWWRNRLGWAPGLRERTRDMESPAGQFVSYDIEPHFQQALATMPLVYGGAMPDPRAERPQALFTFASRPDRPDIRVTRLMTDLYLRSNGIAQGDRLGMESSVELRLPFVDYRLVETVVGLRKAHADWELSGKKWMHDAVTDLLPASVRNRPKRGFEPPYDAWLTAILQRHGADLRDGALVRAGVLTATGAATLAAQSTWNPTWGYQPFAALVLEHWLRGLHASGLPERGATTS